MRSPSRSTISWSSKSVATCSITKRSATLATSWTADSSGAPTRISRPSTKPVQSGWIDARPPSRQEFRQRRSPSRPRSTSEKLLQPLEHLAVPEHAVLRLQDPVPLVGKHDQLRWHTLPLQGRVELEALRVGH